MTRCKFAQTIWNPTPFVKICRSFEKEMNRAEVKSMNLDNLYHHPQFHFPESWGGKRKKTEEENVICLSQVHDMLKICTKNVKSYPLHLPEFWGRRWKGQNWREWIWQPIPPPTISFSRVLRWEKEKDTGRKCNLPAAGAWHVVNLHKQYKILPPTFKFAGVLS